MNAAKASVYGKDSCKRKSVSGITLKGLDAETPGPRAVPKELWITIGIARNKGVI
jgi:hypothetical protein